MISSRCACTSPASNNANRSASRISPILTASARPLAQCRGGRGLSVQSISTARGWWNAPMMFLTPFKLMAVLPPTDESIWESVVVGI